MLTLVLVPVLLLLFPLVYNIIINNSDFFESTFKTFGNTFDIVISSFQMFYDIGTVLPGRLYPIYAFAISMLIAVFVFYLLRLVLQILGAIVSLVG